MSSSRVTWWMTLGITCCLLELAVGSSAITVRKGDFWRSEDPSPWEFHFESQDLCTHSPFMCYVWILKSLHSEELLHIAIWLIFISSDCQPLPAEKSECWKNLVGCLLAFVSFELRVVLIAVLLCHVKSTGVWQPLPQLHAGKHSIFPVAESPCHLCCCHWIINLQMMDRHCAWTSPSAWKQPNTCDSKQYPLLCCSVAIATG